MEIAALTERTEKLSNLAGELQEKIGKGEEEWREWLKQLGLDNSSRVRNGKK